jgi:L,D-peptidoglycan transpeptidase YkuD (ErfK/YbiS/YcfS/YnhG family)
MAHIARMRFLPLTCLLASSLVSAAFEIPSRSSQCVVGVSEGWNSSHVTLSYYEKKGGAWKKVGEDWKGRLGSKGLVWGRGLHPNPAGAALKKEGDGRSPAGVFDLGQGLAANGVNHARILRLVPDDLGHLIHA